MNPGIPKYEKDPRNFLSIDVEDWYHFRVEEPEIWDSLESRVSIGVYRILEILETFKVKATFFILGYVADREPGIVKEIAARDMKSHRTVIITIMCTG